VHPSPSHQGIPHLEPGREVGVDVVHDELQVRLGQTVAQLPGEARGLVPQPGDQLLDHQGQGRGLARLHAIPIVHEAGSEADHVTGLRVPQPQRARDLPRRVLPGEFYERRIKSVPRTQPHLIGVIAMRRPLRGTRAPTFPPPPPRHRPTPLALLRLLGHFPRQPLTLRSARFSIGGGGGSFRNGMRPLAPGEGPERAHLGRLRPFILRPFILHYLSSAFPALFPAADITRGANFFPPLADLYGLPCLSSTCDAFTMSLTANCGMGLARSTRDCPKHRRRFSISYLLGNPLGP
jgi:hypothetical protein